MPIPPAAAIARQFSHILRSWLTADQLAAAITANRCESEPDICHSHDHCDANVAMLIAWKQLGLDPLDTGILDTDFPLMSEACLDRWAEAWSLAKSAAFNPALIPNT